MRLTFVTGNPGKVAELAAQLAPHGIEVVQDTRGYPEVQADTFRDVAVAGAAHLRAAGVATPFLLEDSGLMIDALGGFPGVYSRFALETLGCDGVLRAMRGVPAAQRGAAFRAELALVEDAGVRHFVGEVRGVIAHAARGDGGFGFDPIFVRALDAGGDGRTFAEMTRAEKAALSHRGRAVRALLEALDKSAKT